MINRDSANNQSYVTDVKFLDVEKRHGPEPKHYVYVIQVTWTNPENIFVIYRRYAQFFDLQVNHNINLKSSYKSLYFSVNYLIYLLKPHHHRIILIGKYD